MVFLKASTPVANFNFAPIAKKATPLPFFTQFYPPCAFASQNATTRRRVKSLSRKHKNTRPFGLVFSLAALILSVVFRGSFRFPIMFQEFSENYRCFSVFYLSFILFLNNKIATIKTTIVYPSSIKRGNQKSLK